MLNLPVGTRHFSFATRKTERRVGGIFENPSPPRDLRLLMRLDRQTVRNSIKRVKQWEFEKIIIAHGQLITKNAQHVFNKAFDWI